jgi:hypothetical protein
VAGPRPAAFDDWQANPVVAHAQATEATKITAGPLHVNLMGEGGVGNGGDDSDAIRKTILKTPSGAVFRAPAGDYGMDAETLRMLSKFAIQGDGADSSWFTLTEDTGGAALAVEAIGDGVRGSYGARVRGIGINLVNAPHATGIRLGVDDVVHGAWAACDDVRVEGGAISLDSQAVNAKVSNFHFLNPTQAFVKARENGLELRLDNGIFELSPTFTVDTVLDIQVATGGIKGAVYGNFLTLNNQGTITTGCVLVQCPNGSTASVPCRFFGCTWDNLTVPAYDFRNVTDCHVIGGWANAAAGAGHGAVRFYGGGGHTIAFQQQLNGVNCSIDFAGGSPIGIVLLGNAPSTGPYYLISATGKPSDLMIKDRLYTGAGISNITNDPAGLRVACATRDWTPQVLAMIPFLRESDPTTAPAGVAVIGSGGVPGLVTVSHTLVSAGTRAVATLEDPLGTPAGTNMDVCCKVSDNVAGTSFRITALAAGNVGRYLWRLYDPA